MASNRQFTPRQLARLAGVSIRTLHYYDEVGLLTARRNPNNGYRIYTEPELLQLQQILFLRELGLSLDAIKSVVCNPGFDLLAALQQHRKELEEKQAHLATLLETVERTIRHMKGRTTMAPEELFIGFSEEKQRQYEEEARRRYGDENVRESQKRWGSYSAEKKKSILEEAGKIYRDLADIIPLGPESPQAQQGIARWHQNMRYFYEPTTEVLLGLGDLYNDDPEFNATFNSIHPDLAPFMRKAIRIYCQGK